MKRHILLSLFLFLHFVSYSKEFSAVGTSLFFIENKGQMHDQHYNSRGDIDLKVCQGNAALFIGSGHLHYLFAQAEGKQTRTWRMDVELIGANKHAILELGEQQQYYERYFTTATGGKGVVAHTYARALYKNIYPGIDWAFYIKDGTVKHEFILEEGADPSLIRIKYAGATGLRINTDGSLTAETPLGTVTEARPFCYTNNTKQVASSYQLEDSILIFRLGAYSGRLTIDPSLDWGTYLHVSTNQPYVMALDIALYGIGQIYTCGYTAITDLATVGSHQVVFGGVGDGFLAKFDSAGNRLWATYYGGTDFEVANGLKCDAQGNIYVCGSTGSANAMSTPGSFQDVFGGGDDGFLVKFDSTGDRIWATYFGGNNTDGLEYISIDSAANLYLSGATSSQGLATPGTHQTSIAGQGDVLLAKFDSAGNRIWATYYGGAAADQAFVNAIDGYGSLYLAGNTASTAGIATIGSHQQTYSGLEDGFFAKFDTSGHLSWATYYGGDSMEYVSGILPDSIGNVYIAGTSGDQIATGASPTNIATIGSYMDAPGGLADAFLVKFDSTGQRLWGSYYGGAGFEQAGAGAALAFDAMGDIYFCGRTGTTTGIVSGSVWQPTPGGMVDGYIAKFTPAGNQVWATYYGGLLHDQVNDCVFDGISSLYVIGNSTSDNNIATTGAFQTSNQGGYNNAFLSRVYDCVTPSMPVTLNVDTVCVNDTVIISVPPVNGAISYTWTLPSGWSGSSDSSSIIAVTGSGGGIVSVTANSACGSSTALFVTVPVYTPPFPTVIVIGNQLNTGTFTTYQWYLNGNAITGATSQFYTFTQQGVYTVMVTDSNGCKATSPAFTTGVNELKEENAIQLYPNPNSGQFTINVAAKGTVQIYEITGRLLQTQEIEKGSTRIALPDALPAGLYLLRFIGSEHNTIHHHTLSYQPE